MIVELRQKDAKYPDLTPNQQYVVLGIEADDFRILNDNGRPYLYPNHLFKVVDSREPDDWVTELGEDGERYCYSSPFNEVGFFEDFFDDKPETVAVFWRAVNRQLAAVAV